MKPANKCAPASPCLCAQRGAEIPPTLRFGTTIRFATHAFCHDRMKANFVSPGFRFLFACLVFAVSAAAAGLPGESTNVKLAAPIRTWDEAVSLGNGWLRRPALG